MIKKITIGVLALSFCFVALGAVQVQGEENDIRKEMTALETMLKSIQEQIEGTSKTTVTLQGVPSGFIFNQNLGVGARGVAVKYLQIVLNADSDTRLAQSGAGSPGMETEYFGPITQAAVRKFQSKYASVVLSPIGLTSPTGFVGAQTRAKLNAILVAGISPTTPSVPVDSAILNAIKEVAEAVKSLKERVDALHRAPGNEGSFSVEVRADIRNAEVAASQKMEVAVFRLKAEDSDINVQRVDLYFDHTGTHSTTAIEFRRFIDSIAIYSGDKKLQEVKLSTSNPARNDKYIRFSNLNLIVEKDEYVDLIVEVTGTSRDESRILEIGPTDSLAIRGTDGAGVSQYAGGSTLRRTFTFTGEKAGALEVRRHVDTPKEGVAVVSEKNRTEVDLLKFDLTAKETDVELNSLTVLIEKDNTSLDLQEILQDVLLYKDTTRVEIASVNASTGKAIFDKMEMKIKKGETVTFTLKADALKTEVVNQGASLKATIDKDDNKGVGYDIYDKDIDIDRTISGYKQHLYVVAPEITLLDANIERIEVTKNTDDRAIGEIEFKVKAIGGTIYFDKTEAVKNDDTGMVDFAGFALNFANLASNAKSGNNPLTGLSGDYYYVVRDDTKTFDIGFESQNVAERNRVEVKTLRWAVEDKNGNAVEFEWDGDFVEVLKTNRLSLYWTP